MSILRASKPKKKRGFELDADVYDRLETMEKNLRSFGGYEFTINEKVQALVIKSLDKAEEELNNLKKNTPVKNT